MAGSTHYLPQGFLHIVMVVSELPLSRHIDRILVRFVVRHTASVRTYRYKVVTHLQQEVVETDAQLTVVALRISSLHGTAVAFQGRFIAFLVHIGQCSLVNVEQRADFTVMHTFVQFLFFLAQFQVVAPTDDEFRIVAMDIPVPVVEQEWNALLMLTYRYALRLGIAEECEQVGLATVPVRVQCHEQGVERTDRNTLGIKERISLSRCVEPVASGIRSSAQSRRKQVYLFFFGFLFDLRFLFHIVFLLMIRIIGFPLSARLSPAVRLHSVVRLSAGAGRSWQGRHLPE